MTIFVGRLLPVFQSTLPRGSDDTYKEKQGIIFISIHAPSRERRIPGRALTHSMLFQSTLPRGSDRQLQIYSMYAVIISIHAPSRERHLVSFWCNSQSYNFNPRSLAGATIYTHYTSVTPIYISIHAPSRERQGGTGATSAADANFNPRSLAGATHSLLVRLLQVLRFQSTLPRGSDPLRCHIHVLSSPFQSTLPRGSDLCTIRKESGTGNFNPRSLAGATYRVLS